MFESGYQTIIDKINKIQSHGLSHKFSIPQMAIIGDQSSGKSSVLEAISKLSFPRDKGMCTRFATQVNLRRDTTLKKDMLSARIEGENKFNEARKVLQEATSEYFHAVIKDAVATLCHNEKGEKGVSEKVLEITVSGPGQSPLTIIDLPGFIRTTLDDQDKALPDTIWRINNQYLRDPRTIILAVVQADVDLNASTALSMAGKPEHDPAGDRTIPIITKADRIEQGLHSDWIKTINNRRKHMKFGYLVMRNTSYEDKNSSWERAKQEEQEFFSSSQWNAVLPERKGREAARTFLGAVLQEHISRELPALKLEVDNALRSYKKNVEDMGNPILSIEEARDKLRGTSRTLMSKMEAFLRADYELDYLELHKGKENLGKADILFVRSALGRMYHDYRDAMEEECNRLQRPEIMKQVALLKGNDLNGMVSPIVFKNVINSNFMIVWRRLSRTRVAEMHGLLAEALKTFIEGAANPAAKDVCIRIFGRFYSQQTESINQTLSDIFSDEETPFTLNRYYDSEVAKERPKRNDIPTVASESRIREDDNEHGSDSPPSSGSSPKPSRGLFKSLNPSKKTGEWNEYHTTDEMIPCFLAYLKTARERIVDKVVVETIERHMVKRINMYSDMLHNATDNDLVDMLESPALKKKRTDLTRKIADFEGILSELSKRTSMDDEETTADSNF
ncbi:hypothetical protein EMPS_05176 [Entomortierella parvispora]|uniref:Dynamin-type G domain-containing protein n=1 Tax=Entomortierella parvispora TaxID=205924 RepID=A0A9P3LW78_9FUNG|nr:hypothetical protein EMPS_05176 [Entomortierella parvispora]